MTTSHTQPTHQKSTYDGHRTPPSKAEISRGTPSQKTTGTTGHLQQACPKGLGLAHLRHPILPTFPQTTSLQKTLSQAGTTSSITSHGPSADQPHTNGRHPATTINHQGNPSRHEDGIVPTKHKHTSLYCDLKH